MQAHEEFLHLYTGRPLVKKDVNEKFNVPAHIPSKLSNPQSIDYRTLGYVTEVKNQVKIKCMLQIKQCIPTV